MQRINVDALFNFFGITDNKKHDFTLSEKEFTNTENSKDISKKDSNLPKNIFQSLSVNLECIKSRFSTSINNDIVIREFTLTAKNKHYKAFLLFIDGMVDSNLINDFILKPLMLRNQANTFENSQDRIISEAVTNNITVRKIKKFDIVEYILNCLLPQNSVEKETTFDNIAKAVNLGNCVLFVDTLNIAFNIDVKGFKQRNIESPNNEIIIKGPQEAFVENIRTNTSLIRRITNTEDLIIENISVGQITKTICSVCYLKNIANTDLINEIKYRISNLDIDSLLSSGQLEQLISDNGNLIIPKMISTERPDKAAKYLLQGRILILINGNPYALIAPATLIDFISSPEDSNLGQIFANFLRVLRFISAFITLLLPGLYVAITSFHQEILPTELLYSILASRKNVPFPVIFELIIMEVSFEIIREACLRIPSPISSTLGIVGGLVIGQAAVTAGIVSPILLIIVAITGIASFTIPDFSFGFHLRINRFIFIILGYISGFLGISVGLFCYISFICDLKSFGVEYTAPYATFSKSKGNGYFIPPIWKQEYRAPFIAPKKKKAQEKISMKWKNT